MTSELEIRRGDIVWVNCDPSVGAEPGVKVACPHSKTEKFEIQTTALRACQR